MHAVEKTDIEELLVIVTRLAADFEPRLLDDVGRYRASAKVMIQIRGTLHDIVEEGRSMMPTGELREDRSVSAGAPIVHRGTRYV